MGRACLSNLQAKVFTLGAINLCFQTARWASISVSHETKRTETSVRQSWPYSSSAVPTPLLILPHRRPPPAGPASSSRRLHQMRRPALLLHYTSHAAPPRPAPPFRGCVAAALSRPSPTDGACGGAAATSKRPTDGRLYPSHTRRPMTSGSTFCKTFRFHASAMEPGRPFGSLML